MGRMGNTNCRSNRLKVCGVARIGEGDERKRDETSWQHGLDVAILREDTRSLARVRSPPFDEILVGLNKVNSINMRGI